MFFGIGGNNYADLLEDNLPNLLEDFPLNIRRTMWFQYDGALSHNSSRRVRHYLNTQFTNSWIGPARSLDLNPLDFFVELFEKFYLPRSVESLKDLKEKLYCAVGNITSKMLQLCLIHRVNVCI